jgi:hypothetical protein
MVDSDIFVIGVFAFGMLVVGVGFSIYEFKKMHDERD